MRTLSTEETGGAETATHQLWRLKEWEETREQGGANELGKCQAHRYPHSLLPRRIGLSPPPPALIPAVRKKQGAQPASTRNGGGKRAPAAPVRESTPATLCCRQRTQRCVCRQRTTWCFAGSAPNAGNALNAGNFPNARQRS